MASSEVEVKVEVMDAPIVVDHFRLLKAQALDMTLGGALGGAGAVGLLAIAGVSSHWFVVPASLLLCYRVLVSTHRMKKQMRADESAYELRVEEED